jgi:hypothetical protein
MSKLARSTRIAAMDVEILENLADNLELYVKHLYAIRACIQIGEQLNEEEFEDLLQDYEEAVGIKKVWDSLGEE